jgi:hypothetical protein
MYCKIIEEIQFEKKWRENKMEGGKGLYRTLGWSRDFPKVSGELLKSIRDWRGLFQDP